MESSEMTYTLLITLVSIGVGLLIYIAFFDPWTGERRTRFRGLLKGKSKTLKSGGRKGP